MFSSVLLPQPEGPIIDRECDIAHGQYFALRGVVKAFFYIVKLDGGCGHKDQCETK
jgi:hypothetical protein